MIRKLGVGLIVVGVALLAPGGAADAGGTTFVVTNTADTADGACDADCSLREAIIAANGSAGADEVEVPAGLYTLAIAGADELFGATGDLNITDSLTLAGDGASQTIIDGADLDRVISVFGVESEVLISGLTVQNGTSTGGGGILNINAASLSVTQSVIRDNEVPFATGGGIASASGALILNQTTVTGNSAPLGAVSVDSDTTAFISNTTISSNDGDAIYTNGFLTVLNSTITNNAGQAFATSVSNLPLLFNSILANNTPGVCTNGLPGEHNLYGEPPCNTPAPGDLFGVDPLLGPLSDNGGPTPTHALLPGSPAIDAGTTGVCSLVDQRGSARAGGSCDIGAYEVEGASALAGLKPLGALGAGGTTFAVTKTSDSADGTCDTDCSLREAIIAANNEPGGDFLTLPAGTYPMTIPGSGTDDASTGDLDITDELTLTGVGASTTIVDGSGIDGVLEVEEVAENVRVEGLTIQNSAAFLGAVHNDGAYLALHEVVIRDNTVIGIGAGAIFNEGILFLESTTLSRNVGEYAGGVWLLPHSQALIVNSTVSGNSSDWGSGITPDGSLTMIDSTVAFNDGVGIAASLSLPFGPVAFNTVISENTSTDCENDLIGDHNLDSDGTCGLTGEGDLSGAQALLGPLSDNGGPTPTHALLPGGCPPPPADACTPPSHAIGAGSNVYCLVLDQRGAPRPVGVACDIGAYESGDVDADGEWDDSDNCPTVANPTGQTDDADGDLAGDACDSPGTGNVDCSGPSFGVTSVDALKVLRHSAGLSVTQSEPCLDIGQPRALTAPDDWLMGDVNCSGLVNSVDALLILRANAGLGVALPVGCPEVKPP